LPGADAGYVVRLTLEPEPDNQCSRHTRTGTASISDPAVADPFPATCTNSLPADTVLIDDGSVDDVSTGLNLAGCPQASQSNGGNFSWHPNFDTNLQPIGLVDLHQLGTGYGGHMLFTHLEDPAYKQWGGTAEWDLTASYDVYDVAVFVPGLGAAGTLSYTIYDGRGNQVGQPISVDQTNYTNQWVNLGRFYLGPGAKVTTTNIVPGGDGTTDVAFDAVAFSPVASYAALGDSYSSGVGVGSANYDQGTNTSTNQCLRSADSYARQYGTAHGYPGVLTVHLACSGAVTGNLTTTGQYGEPPQISAIPKHARLVTVTIGGNDAGFGDVLTHCLTPRKRLRGRLHHQQHRPGQGPGECRLHHQQPRAATRERLQQDQGTGAGRHDHRPDLSQHLHAHQREKLLAPDRAWPARPGP
jgi:lysophospholipase L1-like esterase